MRGVAEQSGGPQEATTAGNVQIIGANMDPIGSQVAGQVRIIIDDELEGKVPFEIHDLRGGPVTFPAASLLDAELQDGRSSLQEGPGQGGM